MTDTKTLVTRILIQAVAGATVALILLMTLPAAAQQNNLGDEQIDVVKSYQPTLSDAFKISDIPARDTAVGYVPEMKYEVKQELFPTVYTLSPIKPLRIKDEGIPKLYRGFVKGGYGTKNTPYIELFYNSLRSKTFDAGVHLNHFSSSGKIDGYGYPGMSESGIHVFGTRFLENNLLRAALEYNRGVYHYYGYNKPPDIYSKSETKHSFDDFTGTVGFESNNKNRDLLRYGIDFTFNSFSDNRSNDESRFVVGGKLGKDFDGLAVDGDVVLDYLRYENTSFGADNRTIVRINPRFVTHADKLKITAGANINVEINDLTKYHFYPHIRLDFPVAEDAMNVYGQITGDLERVSYKSLSTENPFLGMDLQLQNANRKFDASGGIYVKLDKQLAFNGSISLVRTTNEAFYRNLPPSNTLVVYDVYYDDNTATILHAEIIYDQGTKTNWSMAAEYRHNKLHITEEPLFEPEFTVELKGKYLIGEKIFLHTRWNYVTSRNAAHYFFTTQNGFATLKGYLDAQLGVDYRYSKVLSVFLDFNNITASRYARWYNYPSYRFGAMAGLTYCF